MKRQIAFVAVGCLLLPAVYGCAEVVVGGALAGAAVAHDRRTPGSVIDDQVIEFKAMDAFHNDAELNERSHINVTSYNGVVLLTGEAPDETLRARAEELVRKIPKVKRVHNEIRIAAPSSLMSRTSDSLITAKVKTSLFKVKGFEGFDPTRVKVVTENGVVYLMGLLTRAEADAVAETVRQVGGVQRVVKVFEYIQ